MTIFQLDENTTSKKFVRECTAQGCTPPLPFPRQWRGRSKKDMFVLGTYMPLENPFVTEDRSIIEDNPGCIPNKFPGIIIIHNAPRPSTMTLDDRMRVIATFKAACPAWDTIVWKNSVVEINYKEVTVWHMEGDIRSLDCQLPYSQSGWQTPFLAALEANANRPD